MPASIKYIRSTEELDSVFSGSYDCPHIILKHSTSCGISAHILHQLTGSINYEINVIVVQSERALSDLVADRTGHRHQSPQIFVLADGKPIYHATHYGIDPDAVNLKLRVTDLAGRKST
ncbi:bacillithiol system redox-active protein YtxJ [soil metagenome]